MQLAAKDLTAGQLAICSCRSLMGIHVRTVVSFYGGELPPKGVHAHGLVRGLSERVRGGAGQGTR